MIPERLMSVAQPRGCQMDGVSSGSARPEYTVAEVGIALGGLPKEERERCYAAFAWRLTADLKERGVLFKYLCDEVYLGSYADPMFVPMAQREGWPRLIANKKYKDKLIKLALQEERMTRHADEAHPLSVEHPFFLHVLAANGFPDMTELLWRRRLEPKYIAIRHVIQTWYATARHHAAEKLYDNHSAA